jgi:hypothetical protein
VLDQSVLVLDCSAERLAPGVVVAIAAGMASRKQRGLETSLKDQRRQPDLWLARSAGFHSTSSSGPAGAFDSFRAISSHREAQDLAEFAGQELASHELGVSPSVRRMARFVFEELGVNIVDHSEASTTGFGRIQTDPELRRLQLAFADCGVGFRTSLQRNPELQGRVEDDAQALQLAITPRLSGAGPVRTNMGIGLGQLIAFSDLLEGDLWIASKTAALHRASVVGRRVNTLRAIAEWPGTWICLDAPLP